MLSEDGARLGDDLLASSAACCGGEGRPCPLLGDFVGVLRSMTSAIDGKSKPCFVGKSIGNGGCADDGGKIPWRPGNGENPGGKNEA